MSHRSPLKGGAPRLLGHHGGAMGKAYRRVYDALESELGPFTVLQRLEAGRVAVCYVQLEAATNALVEAQRQRRHGKGRRPNLEQIERLARRQGLADGSYSQALDKLKELTAANRKRQPASGRELLERMRAGGGA